MKWRKATLKVTWKGYGITWSIPEEFSWLEPQDHSKRGKAMRDAANAKKDQMRQTYGEAQEMGREGQWYCTVNARRFDEDPLDGQ